MNYIKYTFTLTPNDEAFRDVLSATLGEVGFESFEENDNFLLAYIPENLDKEDLLKEIDFTNMFTFSVTKELIPDQNWNEVWEKNYFKPIVIAGKCVIRAPFHTEYPKTEIEIIIEPNMAFGTGNHETTMLIIEALIDENLSGLNVLDMGCGTGILSILASKLGAQNITAIDLDEWAYKGTLENKHLNNCPGIQVFHGDASLLNSNETYDLILANIHKNILINDLNAYSKVLKPGGKIYFSGLFKNELEELNTEASKLGLKKHSSAEKNNWGMLVVTKSASKI